MRQATRFGLANHTVGYNPFNRIQLAPTQLILGPDVVYISSGVLHAAEQEEDQSLGRGRAHHVRRVRRAHERRTPPPRKWHI